MEKKFTMAKMHNEELRLKSKGFSILVIEFEICGSVKLVV